MQCAVQKVTIQANRNCIQENQSNGNWLHNYDGYIIVTVINYL